MNSFPFDSVVTYDALGNPSYDRPYTSESMAGYFHLLFTDGVFANPTTGLLVSESSNTMSVIVNPGACNIQGRLAIETDPRELVFDAADSLDRIDTVVARLNTNHDFRNIDLYVVKGVAASVPTAPTLNRTGGIYELRLADVFIAKNTSMISAERITDTRLVTEDCGIVQASPQTLETTDYYHQLQDALDSFKEIQEDSFVAWVARLQNILDEETAGHLQLEIEALQTEVGTLNSNLGNINVYVGEDEKLHFVNSDGADSVLPFNNSKYPDGIMWFGRIADYSADVSHYLGGNVTAIKNAKLYLENKGHKTLYFNNGSFAHIHVSCSNDLINWTDDTIVTLRTDYAGYTEGSVSVEGYKYASILANWNAPWDYQFQWQWRD